MVVILCRQVIKLLVTVPHVRECIPIVRHSRTCILLTPPDFLIPLQIIINVNLGIRVPLDLVLVPNKQARAIFLFQNISRSRRVHVSRLQVVLCLVAATRGTTSSQFLPICLLKSWHLKTTLLLS